MQKKFKIVIVCSILVVIAIVLVLLLMGLDRLDFEKWGLNYNSITASFSDNLVYDAGLHLVGLSNMLLQVPKTPSKLAYFGLQSFTNDFFAIKVDAQVTYSLKVPSSQQFTFLSQFYVNFGSQPSDIISPIIKNEIIKTISSYSSVQYVQMNATTLQSEIKASAESIVSTWTSLDISIILTSVVVEGVSQNIQLLDRRIASLSTKLQRIKFQTIELTKYIQSIIRNTQLTAQHIQTAINSQIAALGPLLLSENQFLSNDIGKILLSEEIIGQNYSFASSELGLRPQLYTINSSTSL